MSKIDALRAIAEYLGRDEIDDEWWEQHARIELDGRNLVLRIDKINWQEAGWVRDAMSKTEATIEDIIEKAAAEIAGRPPAVWVEHLPNGRHVLLDAPPRTDILYLYGGKVCLCQKHALRASRPPGPSVLEEAAHFGYLRTDEHGFFHYRAMAATTYLCKYCGGTFPLDNNPHLCWHAPDSFEAAHPTHFPRPWREAPAGAWIGGLGGLKNRDGTISAPPRKSIMDSLAPHRHKIKG